MRGPPRGIPAMEIVRIKLASFDLQNAGCVRVKHLSNRILIRRQPTDRGEDPGARAGLTTAKLIIAVASEQQLILMAREEFAGMIFVSGH